MQPEKSLFTQRGVTKDRRLARLGVVVTVRPGMAVYDYPVPE